MENEKETPHTETEEPAVAKRQWKTPDFEEIDVLETASAPPVAAGADGPFAYS